MWQRYITISPSLWEHPDFSEARKRVSPTFLRSCFAGGRAKSAVLRKLPSNNSNIFKVILGKSPRLERLHVKDDLPCAWGIVDVLGLALRLKHLELSNYRICVEDVVLILSNHPLLTHASFHPVEDMTDKYYFLPESVWKDPFAPGMRTLELYSVRTAGAPIAPRRLVSTRSLTRMDMPEVLRS